MSSPTGVTGDGSLAARSRAADAAALALGSAGRNARSFWAVVRHAWRRSIQLRVVVATVALSVSVIAILGFVLMNLVRGGLLDAKERSALSEAYAGLSVAQLTVNNSDATDAAGIDVLMQDLSQDLAQRSSRGRLYAVVVLSSSSNRNQEIPPEERASSFVRRESVPRDLRAAVAEEPGQHYQYTTIYYEDGGQQRRARAGAARRQGRGDVRALLPVSADAGAADAQPGRQNPRRRRHRARPVDCGGGAARDQAGGRSRPRRGSDRREALGGTAAGADGGAR